MGRHSSPDQGPFYRSFFSWIGLWAMIAAVTGIAVWLLVGAIGGDQPQRSVAASVDVDTPEGPEPTVSGLRVANEPEPEPTPTEEPVSRPTSKPEKAPVELITKGITVQVLNGTMKAEAALGVADRLSSLGYSIVTVEESSRVYSDTTVFWSTDASRDAASALAEHFGWVAEPKPANLADTVSLHVVVGADEAQ